MECEVSSWKEIPPFSVKAAIYNQSAPLDFSNKKLFEGADIHPFSSPTDALGLTFNVGDILFFFGNQFPFIGEVSTNIISSDTSSSIESKITPLYIIYPVPNWQSYSPCEAALSGLPIPFIDGNETSVFKLISCPYTDFPPAETSCSWTLLAQVNEEGGDFMTLNSENLITSDWSLITDQKMKLEFKGWGALRILSTDNNATRFSELAGYLRLQPSNSDYHADLETNRINSDVILWFPASETGNVIYNTIPISVNGEFADEYGNIEIEGGTGGDYIPLTGTEVGKPVTGNIILNNYSRIQLYDNSDFGGGMYMDFTVIEGDFAGKFSASNKNYQYVAMNCEGLLSNRSQIYVVPQSEHIAFKGLVGKNYFGQYYTDNTYIQKIYADKQHSYSLTEYKTGGKWLPETVNKDIYKITKLTSDPAPTVDIMIKSTVVGGTYTEYEYTKLAE